MNLNIPKVALSEGLSIRDLLTTGSTLKINEVYDETDDTPEHEPASDNKVIDFIGEPVQDFHELAISLTSIDPDGYVKRKIIEEGGGLPINDGCTVSIAYAGYWENANEPFDVRSLTKPLEVDLSDSGLLTGLEMAVKSMLVGELSVFLLSYKVMYKELGIPPRIKPKADCVFYIKLIRSILTNKDGKINFSEPNIFKRVRREVLKLYSSGYTLYKSSEYSRAINLFNKAVHMLHKCRLADEHEENIQEKLLRKLYLNLAIVYIKTKQPLKACTACNELNRLGNLFNNDKALLQNAKALRMIGEFDRAEQRVLRAMKLNPNAKELEEEYDLLYRTRESCDQMKMIGQRLLDCRIGTLNEQFKQEVDILINNFKYNENLCKLALPSNLSPEEMEYVRNACIRENLFCSKMSESCLDIDSEVNEISEEIEHFTLAKEPDSNSDAVGEGSLIGEDCQILDFGDDVSFPPLNSAQ